MLSSNYTGCSVEIKPYKRKISFKFNLNWILDNLIYDFCDVIYLGNRLIRQNLMMYGKIFLHKSIIWPADFQHNERRNWANLFFLPVNMEVLEILCSGMLDIILSCFWNSFNFCFSITLCLLVIGVTGSFKIGTDVRVCPRDRCPEHSVDTIQLI